MADVLDRSHLTVPDWLAESIYSDCAGGRVLDLGCGTGSFTSTLGEHASEVVGIDTDADRVALADDRAESVTVGSATDLPFRENQFDAIVSIEVIEHIPDSQRFFSEMARVLSDNGVAYVKTPNKVTHDPYFIARGSLRDAREEHVNVFHPRRFQKEADQWFDIEFMDTELAEYQRDKISDVSSLLGSVANRLPWRRLPTTLQPSLVARCTPRSL